MTPQIGAFRKEYLHNGKWVPSEKLAIIYAPDCHTTIRDAPAHRVTVWDGETWQPAGFRSEL